MSNRNSNGNSNNTDCMNNENLDILLNNELYEIVSGSVLDVTIEKINRKVDSGQNTSGDSNIFPKQNTTDKVKHRRRRLAVIICVFLSAILLRSSRSYEEINPFELLRIGESYDSVISKLGEPDNETNDSNITYDNIDYMGQSGNLLLHFTTYNKLYKYSWTCSCYDNNYYDTIYKAIYDYLTEIYGENEYTYTKNSTWYLNGYIVALSYYDYISVDCYIVDSH